VAKHNEIEYAQRMDQVHAAGKPFSDVECARHLSRLGAIFALLPPPPARILDLGCGTGWTSLFFARAGYKVVGVDIAPEMIRLASAQRDAAGLKTLTFIVSDYEALAFRDEFDAVVFVDSLHHAEDESLAIQRAFTALKPGGVCIADEPGEGHAHTEHSLTAIAKYGVTEKDMPPEHVVELGRAAGFTGFSVFPSPSVFHEEVYIARGEPTPDPFAVVDSSATTANRGLLGRLRWRARLAAARSESRWRKLLFSLQQLRTSGLVLMQKGVAQSAKAAA
jgi:SAM-dependent methyltransferase